MLPELKKLYLSGNKVATLDSVKSLPALTDITLDGNPIDKCEGIAVTLKEKFPKLVHYNLQKLMQDAKLEPLSDKTNEPKKLRTPLGLVSDSQASVRGKENKPALRESSKEPAAR